MASFSVDGCDSLIAGLADMAESIPELRDTILKAEADAAEPIIRQGVSAAGLVDSGALQRSIGRSQVKHDGAPAIRIGPKGEHHRYLPSKGKNGIATAGNVGYVHEYGAPSRGIRARRWLSNASDRAKGPAFDVAEAVYDDYMKKHNL